MEFSYVAVNEKNRKYRNRMTANTKEEVKRKLEQRGLCLLYTSPSPRDCS